MATSPTQQRKVPICSFYLKNACTNGLSCRFSHQIQSGTSLSGFAQTEATRGKENPVCPFYAKGNCQFGSTCRQFHPGYVEPETPSSKINLSWRIGNKPEAKKSVSCAFFGKGMCSKGDSCPFVHDKPEERLPSVTCPIVSDVIPTSEKSTAPSAFGPCKFFLRGSCTKGLDCTFEHPTTTAAPTPRQGEVVNVENGNVTAKQSEVSHTSTPLPEPKAEGLTSHRSFFGCEAIFGDGASLEEISTAFESKNVVISNLPPTTSQRSLIELLEPFGDLILVTLNKYTDANNHLANTVARAEFASPQAAARAAQSLNDTEFGIKRIAVRVDLRAVEIGTGNFLSRKVKVSWFVPSLIAWAHYGSIKDARQHARVFDGFRINERTISAHFQFPDVGQHRSFSVELRGLPLDVSRNQLEKVGNTRSISFGKRFYRTLDERTDEVRRILSECGPLEAFDVLPYDNKKTKVTAFAQFFTAEGAAGAVRKLHGQKSGSPGGGPLWLEQVHSVKFVIPLRQFRTVKCAVEKLRDEFEKECKIRFYDSPDGCGGAGEETQKAKAYVRIYGADAKALGKAKIKLEKILKGMVVVSEGKDLWDEYFETEEAEAFFLTLNQEGKMFVKRDTRLRRLELFGADDGCDLVRGKIVEHLQDVMASRHIVRLEKNALRALISGGLKELLEGFGEGKVVMDVVARTLSIKSDEEETQRIRRALAIVCSEAGSTRSNSVSEEACPVCFCDVTDPTRLSCGHAYCTQCLQHFLQSSTGTNFSVLKCVAETAGDSEEAGKSKPCDELISYSIIRTLLPSADETALLRSSFLAYIHSHPKEFHYCPTPDCPTIYRSSPPGTTLHCPSCLSLICASCHVESHSGLTCAEHQDNLSGGFSALQKWREENGVKPCPNCKADIEKSGGCNHMRCVRCGTHICWVCMKTFDDRGSGGGVYGHMEREHGGIGI